MADNNALHELVDQIFELPAEDQAELMQRLIATDNDLDYIEREEAVPA